MVSFHHIWTTAMSCFLDSRDCGMFNMQQQDSLHRNGNITISLILEKPCTGYQLNRGLISKYWCMLTRPNTTCPQLMYQNWWYLTNLQEGWEHVMSLYHLVEHRTKSKLYGDLAFQNAAPALWNKLLIYICQYEPLAQFKHHLTISFYTWKLATY